MPNYVLSRTSPPAHIYERKINLGYGIKVDTSDAPPEPNKKKIDVEQTVDVVHPVQTAAFADGSVFENRVDPDSGEATENEAQNDGAKLLTASFAGESLVNRD